MTSSPETRREPLKTTPGVSILSARGGDPFPLYEELRSMGPVHWDVRLRGWIVLSYALCRDVETR